MTERELVENYLRIDKRMPIATSHPGGYAVAYPLRRTMPAGRVSPHQGEVAGRVPIAEVARPAAQEAVHVPHDLLHRNQQPPTIGQLTHPIAGVLHRLARWPASEEGEMARARGAAAHPVVVEAEEVEALALFPQVGDPRLGLLGPEPELGRSARSAARARRASRSEPHITTRSSA
jgi:hypothetical protein